MLYVYLFILGTAVGSFLNVLIDRWSNDEPITGRSHCDFCKKQLKPIDLIPIFSFIFLRGRSRCCNKKLSWQYLLVELITGAMFVLVYVILAPLLIVQNQRQILDALPSSSAVLYLTSVAYQNDGVNLFLLLGLVSCLIVVFFADVKYRIIPDQIQVLFLIFSLLLQIFITLQSGCGYEKLLNCYIAKLLILVIAGVAVMLPILLIYLLSRGKGMGFGDVKLAFNMGILLGIKGGLLAIYFAFIIGGIFGAYLLLSKKKKPKSKIAFGPFLVLGTIIILFFSPQIFLLLSEWYGI